MKCRYFLEIPQQERSSKEYRHFLIDRFLNPVLISKKTQKEPVMNPAATKYVFIQAFIGWRTYPAEREPMIHAGRSGEQAAASPRPAALQIVNLFNAVWLKMQNGRFD